MLFVLCSILSRVQKQVAEKLGIEFGQIFSFYCKISQMWSSLAILYVIYLWVNYIACVFLSPIFVYILRFKWVFSEFFFF